MDAQDIVILQSSNGPPVIAMVYEEYNTKRVSKEALKGTFMYNYIARLTVKYLHIFGLINLINLSIL